MDWFNDIHRNIIQTIMARQNYKGGGQFLLELDELNTTILTFLSRMSVFATGDEEGIV